MGVLGNATRLQKREWDVTTQSVCFGVFFSPNEYSMYLDFCLRWLKTLRTLTRIPNLLSKRCANVICKLQTW